MWWAPPPKSVRRDAAVQEPPGRLPGSRPRHQTIDHSRVQPCGRQPAFQLFQRLSSARGALGQDVCHSKLHDPQLYLADLHAGRVSADGTMRQPVAGESDSEHTRPSTDLERQDRTRAAWRDRSHAHVDGIAAPKARNPGQQHFVLVSDSEDFAVRVSFKNE